MKLESSTNIYKIQYCKFRNSKRNRIYPDKSLISFKGLNKIGEEIIGEQGAELKKKFSKKIIRFVEESLDSIKNIIRKIKKENDLPFTNKPLIAAASYDDSCKYSILEAKKLLDNDQVPDNAKKEIKKRFRVCSRLF